MRRYIPAIAVDMLVLVALVMLAPVARPMLVLVVRLTMAQVVPVMLAPVAGPMLAQVVRAIPAQEAGAGDVQRFVHPNRRHIRAASGLGHIIRRDRRSIICG